MDEYSVQFNPLIAKLQGYFESNKSADGSVYRVQLARYICQCLSSLRSDARVSSFRQQVSHLLTVMLISCQDLAALHSPPSVQPDGDSHDVDISQCGASEESSSAVHVFEQRESCRAMLPRSLTISELVSCLSCHLLAGNLQEMVSGSGGEFCCRLVSSLTVSLCDCLGECPGSEVWHSLPVLVRLCCLAADRGSTRPLNMLVQRLTGSGDTSPVITDESTGDIPGITTNDIPGNTSGDIPGSATNDIPGNTSGDIPGSTTSDVPGSATSDISDEAIKNCDDFCGHELAALFCLLADFSNGPDTSDCNYDSADQEAISNSSSDVDRRMVKIEVLTRLSKWAVQRAVQILQSCGSSAVRCWSQLLVPGCRRTSDCGHGGERTVERVILDCCVLLKDSGVLRKPGHSVSSCLAGTPGTPCAIDNTTSTPTSSILADIVSLGDIDALLTLCGALWCKDQLMSPTLSLRQICRSVTEGDHPRRVYLTHCLISSLPRMLKNQHQEEDVARDKQDEEVHKNRQEEAVTRSDQDEDVHKNRQEGAVSTSDQGEDVPRDKRGENIPRDEPEEDVPRDEQCDDVPRGRQEEEVARNVQCDDVLDAVETLITCDRQSLLISDVNELARQLTSLNDFAVKDKLIHFVVGFYLTSSRTSVLLKLDVDLRQSDWLTRISSMEAKLTPAQLTVSTSQNQIISSILPLAVQHLPSWISRCVTSCHLSDGRCQLQCHLLSLVQSRVDLQQVMTSESNNHLETSLLSTLSSCGDDNAQARVCKLLVASVKCCALSASVLKRVISDPTAYSAPVCLQIIQLILADTRCVELVSASADDLPVSLTEYCIISLDRTLDLDRDQQFSVNSRQMALLCMEKLGESFSHAVCCERVRHLLSRCHPLSQLYGHTLLLSEQLPGASDEAGDCLVWQLLACLVTSHPEKGAACPAHLHSLFTATLASFLPYLCESEWCRVHASLMHHGAPRLSAAPGDSSCSAPGSSPGDASRLAAVCWFYMDLLCLWITPPENNIPAGAIGSAPNDADSAHSAPDSAHPETTSANVESLCLNGSDLLHCINCICQQITRCLGDERQSAADWRLNQLSTLMMPLTHGLVLLHGRKQTQYQSTAANSASQPLEQLVLFVCTEFIKQITAMISDKSTDSERAPLSSGGGRPVDLFASVDGMDACSHVLSQFVVALFNIPNVCSIKRHIVQHVSKSVLAHLVQSAPQLV